MKMVVISICCLLSVFVVDAQSYNWSTGIRLGARYDNIDYSDMWNKEKINPELSMFIKRKVYKRFEIEVNLNYFHLNEVDGYYNETLANGQRIKGGTYTRQNILYSSFGIVYNFIRKSKIKSFITGGVVNRHVRYKRESKYILDDIVQQYEEDKNVSHSIAHTIYLGLGVDYIVTKKIFFTLNSRVEASTDDLIHSRNISKKMDFSLMPTMQLGIGYKF